MDTNIIELRLLSKTPITGCKIVELAVREEISRLSDLLSKKIDNKEPDVKGSDNK